MSIKIYFASCPGVTSEMVYNAFVKRTPNNSGRWNG